MLNKWQRRLFAEKFVGLANIGVGALVFGTLVSKREFDIRLGILGFIIYVVLATAAFILTRREEN